MTVETLVSGILHVLIWIQDFETGGQIRHRCKPPVIKYELSNSCR